MKSSKEKSKPSTPNAGQNQSNPQNDTSFEDSETIDAPTSILPEWSDSEISAEKWQTKHAFEDTEFPFILPKSLRKDVDCYKRAIEIITDGQNPVVIMPIASIEDSFRGNLVFNAASVGFGSSETINENQFIQKSNQSMCISVSSEDNSARPAIGSNLSISMNNYKQNDPSTLTSKFFQNNQHLLKSELMTVILGYFHFLFDNGKGLRANAALDEFCLWDCIYPKNKDGSPMYNPSGKYAVKLFWLGSWRKVLIDDRIPLSATKKPLFITSPVSSELWPFLICKALIKLASYSYNDLNGFQEYGDFDVFYALKGWIPERLNIDEKGSKDFYTLMKSFNLKAPQPANRGSMLLNTKATPNQNPASNRPVGAVSLVGLEQYTVALGYRDVSEPDEENPTNIQKIGYPFRIYDVREKINNISESEEEKCIENNYQVKIRCYFSCGYIKNSVSTTGLTASRPESSAADESLDIWVNFDDFFSSFRGITLYHNPISFKNIKSISLISDSNKPLDSFKIPPILSSQEQEKQPSLLVCISTFGQTRSDIPRNSTVVSIETYDWKYGLSKIPLIKITSNAISSTLFKMNAGQSYRILIDCPTSYNLSIFSREEFVLDDESKYLQEKHGLYVKDYEDTYPTQTLPNSWAVLFKQIIYFDDPTIFLALLYVNESVQQHTNLRMIDNDTSTVAPQVFYLLKPRQYLPNKSGYTLIADIKTPLPRYTGKWKVRTISDPAIPLNPERPIEMWMKHSIQDIEEAYVANKHNILFRYVLKVKDVMVNYASIQVSFHGVCIRLQLFYNDVEIFNVRGQGCVSIPSFIFYYSEDSQKPEKEKPEKEKPEKEKLDKSAAIAKDKPSSVQTSFRPTGRHKYILQATVENPEAAKSSAATVSSLVIGEIQPVSNRALNVTPGKPSSASSKKKKTIAIEEKPISTEPSWQLRIISIENASMTVQKDTEKEDHYRLLKDSWESGQSGRSNRAQEIRDLYIKTTENGAILPIFKKDDIYASKDAMEFKPWTILRSRPNSSRLSTASVSCSDKVSRPFVFISDEDWVEMQKSRLSNITLKMADFEEIKTKRKLDKDKRMSNSLMRGILDAQIKEIEELQNIDSVRRIQYRERLIKEIEEVRAVEFLKASETAEGDEDGKKRRNKK